MPVYLATLIGLIAGLNFNYFPILSTVFLTFPTLILLSRKRFLMSLICLVVSLSGFLYSISQSLEHKPKGRGLLTLQGEIISGKSNLYHFRDKSGQTFRVFTKESLERGRFLRVECFLVDEPKNPFTYKGSPLCYAQKISSEGEINPSFLRKVQEKINTKLRESLESPVSSVMIAMTTGVREEIRSDIIEDFRKTGLIHLLSISGAHFSLLFTFFLLSFRSLLKLLPYRLLTRLTLHAKPSQIAIMLSFPPLLFYFLIIEPSHPSTRAFIMSTLFMVGVLSERKALWLKTVLAASLVITIIDPSSVFDLSFQLSFLAVLGIGFVSDIFKEFRGRIKSKPLSYLLISLLVSFAATLFTAPLVIYRFNYLSLISPISNLTAGLLIGMILFPLNLVFVIIYLTFGVYPFPELINSLGLISFKLMHWLSNLSFSSVSFKPIPVGTVLIFLGALLLLLLCYYGTKAKTRLLLSSVSLSLILFSVVLTLLLVKRDREFLKITFLDAGQADSVVIETPKEVFLIDTGRRGYEAELFLKAKGYREIDALILTHEQSDHAGGFFRILEKFKVKEIWHNGYIKFNSAPNVTLRALTRGDIVKTQTCTFTILHPYRGFYHSSLERDSNELSMVFKLKCYEKNYLFTADTGVNALETIPANYLKAEVIKVPHHGSRGSFYPEFYEAVSPSICVISVGRRNPYGHPHREVTDYLQHRCSLYRTDRDGAIQFREDRDGNIEVQTYEESRLKPYKDWENLKKLLTLW